MELPEVNSIAFLPWVELSEPVEIGRLRFVPWSKRSRKHDNLPEPYLGMVPHRLEVYVDSLGVPVTSCTIILPKDDFFSWADWLHAYDEIALASSLLYLAAFEEQEYFRTDDNYVNSRFFEPILDQFTSVNSPSVTKTRRRDGSSLIGYPSHRRPIFQMPCQLQNKSATVTKWDREFLTVLDQQSRNADQFLSRLITALPFFRLATTDDHLIDPHAELILIVSAFETLLGSPNGKRDFSTKLLAAYRKAFPAVPPFEWKRELMPITDRPDDSPFGAWAFELHHYRSKIAHGKSKKLDRTTWQDWEHLLIAGMLFPLLLKLQLAETKHYHLSQRDKKKLRALEPILCAVEWDVSTEQGNHGNRWREIMWSADFDLRHDIELAYASSVEDGA